MMLVAALMARILIPAGYMPGMADGAFVMQPCDGWAAKDSSTHTGLIAGEHAHAVHDKDYTGGSKHHDLQAPCAFSALASAALAGIHPALLAIAVALLVAALFRAERSPVLERNNWLRPPPQGPPLAG
jgi:hypothetical protein